MIPAESKVHLVFVLRWLNWGGIATSLLRLVPYLLNAGDRVSVVEIRAENEGPLVATFREAGCAVHSRDVHGIVRLREIIRLGRFLKSLRPDLLVSSGMGTNVTAQAAATLFRIKPRVARYHNTYTWKERSRAWERRLARFMRRQVFVSEAVRDAYVEATGVNTGRGVVLHNGVDLDRFADVSPDRVAEMRRTLGLSDDEPILLSVGRLAQQKAQDVMLDAMPRILEECPRARLVLAGPCSGAWGEAFLERLRQDSVRDRVIVAGVVHDMPALYAMADVMLLPSRHEGHPNTLLEAMAAGCPTVASDIPCIREVANGVEGVRRVPVDDVRALATAIIETLQAEIYRDGLRAAAGRFSMDSTASAYLDLFESLLRNP